MSSSHRIVFLQASSVHENYGGIESFQDEFLESCAELFSKASVCSIVPQRGGFKPLSRNYTVYQVPFSKNRWVQKFENRFSLRYFRKTLRVASDLKPTVIIAGHVSLAPIAYAVHRLCNIPFIINAHGIEIWGGACCGCYPHDRWCLNRADAIMPTSFWTKDFLAKQGYSPDTIHVVQPRLPTAFESLSPPNGEKRARPFTLVTVSRLDAHEQYKGHDHVFIALAKLKQADPSFDFRYLIRGEGTDKPRLEALIKELGLTSWVEFRPRTENRMGLRDIFSEANVYVMPSRFGYWDKRWRGEGFGIVFLEAAACGLALIAYRCGGPTDIIENEKSGFLVEPDNVDALAKSIRILYDNPSLCNEMGKTAYNSVMARFTRNNMRRQIEQLLSAMFNDGHA